MRSDLMKKGIERAPHRSLMKAMGYTNEEISRPLIGIAHAHNEIIPGHIHLDKILEAVKTGVRMAGGTPIAFSKELDSLVKHTAPNPLQVHLQDLFTSGFARGNPNSGQ